MTRGYRNNNPLNIRHNKKNNWRGIRAVQTDKEFVQFESIEMGYRAAALVLLNYRYRYQRRTIRQIITRWAPQTENNTYVYILHVCDWTLIHNPDHVLELNELPYVLAAMSRQENGIPADMKQVRAGFELAISAWHVARA